MMGTVWRMMGSGGGASAAQSTNDLVAGVASGLIPTGSSGDFDLASTAMGSTTPKLLYAVANEGNNNFTYAANLKCSVGAADGTNQRVVAVMSDDGAAIANTGKRTATDEIYMYLDNTGAVLLEGNFKEFAAGKATLTRGADSLAYTPHIGGLLLGGSDLSVAVGHMTLSTQDTEVDVTGLLFPPDALIFFSVPFGTGSSFGDVAGTADLCLSNGFAVDGSGGIEQCSYAAFDQNNETTTATDGTARNNRCFATVSSSGLITTAELTAFNADGFSIAARDGDGSSRTLGYMALKLTNGQFKTDVLDTPTITGNQKYSLPFRPKALVLIGTAFTAENSLQSSGEGCIWCHSLLAETERSCATYFSENGVATSNCASGYFSDTDIALAVRETDNSGWMYQADHVSFDSDGFTLNFTTADGTARKVLMLAAG